MARKLKEELRRSKEKRNKDALEIEGIVEQTNQLLLSSHKEDEETKRALQIHSKVSYENEVTDTVKRLKIHDDIYKQESFSGAQIKQLCNKYDLRILPISEYTGKVPPELYRKVREFAEANKTENVLISDSNFFILAPVELFETRKVRKILDKDPILFYKTPSNNTYSRKVDKSDVLINVYDWGNDFSFLRKLRYLWNDHKEYSNDGISNRTRTIIFLTSFTLLALIHISGLMPYFVATMCLAIIMSMIYIGGVLTEDKIEDLWNTNEI